MTIENLEGEVWRDVLGYEGYYQVSNLGRVKGIDRFIESVRYNNKFIEGNLLKSFLNRSGYLYCFLSRCNKVKSILTHRLVAICFLENTDNKKEVNHKDLNKINNNVTNLEWCTASENQFHAIKNGAVIRKKSYNHNNSKFTKKDIEDIRLLEKHLNYTEISKIFNVHKSTISRVFLPKQYKT